MRGYVVGYMNVVTGSVTYRAFIYEHIFDVLEIKESCAPEFVIISFNRVY